MVRYLARLARSVAPMAAADLGIAKDSDQLVDRFDQALLRVDQRIVGQGRVGVEASAVQAASAVSSDASASSPALGGVRGALLE